MDYLYIATGFAIFIAVALLVEGVYILWNAKYGSQAQRVSSRLRGMTASSGITPQELLLHKGLHLSGNARMQRFLEEIALANRLGRLLVQSGSLLSVTQFFLISAALFGAVMVALMLADIASGFAVALALAASTAPLLWAMRKKAGRLALLEGQLPEALELMSRALRAGHAFPSAIKMAADEIPEPLGGEFRVLFNEVNYGVPMQDALKNLAARIPGSDIGFFVVAVLIQRESGGNLSELLDTIARIVRERLKLLAQVQVFSAEGRLSAWILGVLPFVLGGVLYMVNPNFMEILWKDPSGFKMLGAVLVLMVIGVIWMRSVIRIRV